MKISEIIMQLQAVLPKYTDKFSDVLVATSLTKSGTTATMAFATAHGIPVNDYILVKGAYSKNAITSLTAIGGIATAVCAANHDLTLEEGTTVIISGATESKYNGTKTLLSVDSGKIFTYAVDEDTPAVATGSPVLNEDRANGFNGRVKVLSVPTPQSFTYAVDAGLSTEANGTIKAVKLPRISGALTQEWIEYIYTQQQTDKLWLFVVPGETVASHNRQIQNDATFRYSPGQVYLQEIIQRPKIIIMIPTANEAAGRAAFDSMETIRPAILKSLLGVKFSSELSNGAQYGLTFVRDGVAGYNGAYYAHEFDFEIPTTITNNDICNEDDSVAWRSFQVSMLNLENGDEIKKISGELP